MKLLVKTQPFMTQNSSVWGKKKQLSDFMCERLVATLTGEGEFTNNNTPMAVICLHVYFVTKRQIKDLWSLALWVITECIGCFNIIWDLNNQVNKHYSH